MAVDYNDERFAEVEADKKVALQEVEDTYNGMVKDSDSYYKAQIDANKQWEEKQTQLQQEQTDFAIDKIEQEKAQAQKDYTKEQSGAYVDWQKQSDQHGVRAEQIADMGMQNTGYSESSQVSMYNTYQNRVATAREAFSRAVLDYNNAITQARLQNNSILAEIAANALKQRLELSLQGFQYKNQLLLDLSNKKLEVDTLYHQRYQDVLNQINQENSLAEQIRQFNEQMAFQREQFEWQKSKSSGGGVRQKNTDPPDETGLEIRKNKGNDGPLAVFGPGENDASEGYRPSDSVKGKIASLEMTSGMGGGKDAIANSIVAYEQTGKITVQDAEYMLRHFGFKPSDYYE